MFLSAGADSSSAHVYTNFMASLVRKTVRGHHYWQIVECRRIDGKPRPIVLAHLGKADDLLGRLQGQQPLHAHVRDFGAVVALWQLAQELGVRELIDQHVGKRHQGLAVSEYLVLAAIHRILQPGPKTRVAAWFKATVLPRLCSIQPEQLTSQRFWDHMNYVDAQALLRIEEDLSRRLVQSYQLDLRTLFFDATNFDTFVDSANPAALPQRGHAKSKRTDLRIVGLALLVSADFNIPLFWHVYPGNQPDSQTFKKVLPTLARRHRQLLPGVNQHITIVFDKGNNSEENIDRLARTPYHVIGSLVPTQHPDLLAISLRKFRRLSKRFPGTQVHRTSKVVFGRSWTIVITRSQGLLRGQKRGIRQHLRKKLRQLQDLQRKLARSQEPGARGHGYTKESVNKHLQEITRGQYIAEFLKTSVGDDHGKLTIHYEIDQRARQRLEREVLGKRILFTDNADWTNEDIVAGYRGQHHVERAFRDLKDLSIVQFTPLFHWTDSKIRVHAFTCVLALTLTGLVHRKVVRAGIELSRGQLLNELKQIREITNVYPATLKQAGRLRSETTLTERSPQQERLCQILSLPITSRR